MGRRQCTARTNWKALHFPTEVRAGGPSLGNGGHMHRKTTGVVCNDRRRAPTIRARLNRHHTADTCCQTRCAWFYSPDSRFCTMGWLCAVTRGTEQVGWITGEADRLLIHPSRHANQCRANACGTRPSRPRPSVLVPAAGCLLNLFVQLGFAFRLQRIESLAHRLGGDMDHSSETLLQFENHSDRAGDSDCAKGQGDRRCKIAGGE